MPENHARDIILAIRAEIEGAADSLLSAAEAGLGQVAAARAGDTEALDAVEAALCAVLEACSFQDLTGQRLSKLEELLAATTTAAPAEDSLENGPALPGQGLDQAAADRVFG